MQHRSQSASARPATPASARASQPLSELKATRLHAFTEGTHATAAGTAPVRTLPLGSACAARRLPRRARAARLRQPRESARRLLARVRGTGRSVRRPAACAPARETAPSRAAPAAPAAAPRQGAPPRAQPNLAAASRPARRGGAGAAARAFPHAWGDTARAPACGAACVLALALAAAAAGLLIAAARGGRMRRRQQVRSRRPAPSWTMQAWVRPRRQASRQTAPSGCSSSILPCVAGTRSPQVPKRPLHEHGRAGMRHARDEPHGCAPCGRACTSRWAQR